MNLFQILDVTCEDDILTVVSAVKFVFTLIQWAIPAVLIVMGTIDMFKAMASADEKKTKEAQQKFIRRLIYAVVAFLIPFIISLVFTFVGKMISHESAQTGKTTYDNFFSCWEIADGSVPANDDDPMGYCECEDSDIKVTSKSACDTASGYCTFTEK